MTADLPSTLRFAWTSFSFPSRRLVLLTSILTFEETEAQTGPAASECWSPDLNPGGLVPEKILVTPAQNRLECW